MKNILNWFKKNIETIEFYKFKVSITTSCDFFMIRYPKKDYSPKISECISGSWSKTLNVIKNNILYIEVYVNNQKKIVDLLCEIKIEELNNDNETVNISNFSFITDTEVGNFKWKRFEIKSIFD